MALTGLQIFKLLPGTNCGDCNVPTCLAFAMKLAAKKGGIEECPHASEEVKELLLREARPPVAGVRIGIPPTGVMAGEEAVLFRHEKTFVNPTALGVVFSSSDPAALEEGIRKMESMRFQRGGESLSLNLAGIRDDGEEGGFLDSIRVVLERSPFPPVLISSKRGRIEKGLELSHERNPLVYGAAEDDFDLIFPLVKEFDVPLVLRGRTPEILRSLAGTALDRGFEKLILAPETDGPKALLASLVNLRRSACLERDIRSGFPLLVHAGRRDPDLLSLEAVLSIYKYGSILLMDRFDAGILYSMMILRQNIYTDPRKPLQVAGGLLHINDPGPDSPLLVTTNFSLTYFIVSGEAESSSIPCHLLIVECDGMSVLTAWSAGKFTEESISSAVRAVEAGLNGRTLVIPGYVSILLGRIEEKLPEWRVVVGPEEASDLPEFMKDGFSGKG